MSDYAIIFQGLAGLLALFFIFLTYMNTKTWRWVHVTAMFFVFAASLAFLYFAAATLKTRANWIKLHDNTEKAVNALRDQVEKVTRGDPLDVQHKTPSVVSVREELGRTILDRGRVWRGCLLTNIAPQQEPGMATITLATGAAPPAVDPNQPAPAAPAGAAAAAPPARRSPIEPRTILHAFREGPPKGDGSGFPSAYFYLGEFQVTASTEASVTIVPTMPLTLEQQTVARAPTQTGGPPLWTLYEVCPIDGHEWLAGKSQKELENLLPLADIKLPKDAYDKLIQSYARDGQKADPMTDPPENVWVKIKFTKPYEIEVDAATVNSVDSEPFNTQGLAVLDRLRKAKPGKDAEKVKFGPEADQIQTAVVDQQTAQKLFDEGVCTKEEYVYHRKLTDYERSFRSLYLRTVELTSRLRQLDADNKAILAATEKADTQAKLLDDLKAKLNADLAKVKFELAELNKYAAALDASLIEKQGQLSQLYKSNKALSRELNEQTARLTEEINRRTKEATARNP
jgi:hypothetical protein